MRPGRGERQRIARPEGRGRVLTDPDREGAVEDEEEFLAVVRIGAVALRSGAEDEELRLEHRRVTRQLLDAHRLADLRHPALGDPDRPCGVLRTVEQVEHGRAVGRRQPLQARHRGMRGAALDGADIARRESGSICRLAEGQALRQPQLPQPRAGIGATGRALPGRRPVEQAQDARGVEVVARAHGADAAQSLHVGAGVQPIATAGASRCHEPLPLPQPQRRG
jgi:hypothetical protein